MGRRRALVQSTLSVLWHGVSNAQRNRLLNGDVRSKVTPTTRVRRWKVTALHSFRMAGLSAAKAGAFFLWCNGQAWHKPMTFQAEKKPMVMLKLDRPKEMVDDEAGLDF